MAREIEGEAMRFSIAAIYVDVGEEASEGGAEGGVCAVVWGYGI